MTDTNTTASWDQAEVIESRQTFVKRLWRKALAYVLRIARLKRRFHELGLYLQKNERIKDCWFGLERHKGTLVRVKKAWYKPWDYVRPTGTDGAASSSSQ